jgi:hypothetical protein
VPRPTPPGPAATSSYAVAGLPTSVAIAGAGGDGAYLCGPPTAGEVLVGTAGGGNALAHLYEAAGCG